MKRERGTVARAIQSVVGGEVSHVAGSSSYDPWEVKDDKNRVWKVVADSSLGNVAAHLRAEIVTPVLSYEDIADLKKWSGRFDDAGRRSTKSAGFTSMLVRKSSAARP